MGTPPPTAPAVPCEKCGAQVALGSLSCIGCGSPIASALPPVPNPSISEPTPEKASIWIPVKLASIPVVAGLVTALAERDAPPGEAIGYWIGMMLLPTLVALAAVRFKPAKRMRTFSTIFFCIGLIALGSGLSSIRHLSGPKKTVQEIVQEAAGTKPVTESGSPSEQKSDRVMREFMADILAARKKHDADLVPLEPVLATMYTAPSFRSKNRMDEMAAALGNMLKIDGEMLGKFQRLPQEIKARVDASDLDPSTKKDVLLGFEQGYSKSEILTAYGEVRANEEKWVAASIDLYSFASHHASDIKTTDKKIVIAHETLSEFNTKFNSSRELRKQLDESNQRLTTLQAATMQKTGISKSDMGLR